MGNMSSQWRSLTDAAKVSDHAVLTVQQDETHVWICFDDGTRFAQLNSHLSGIVPLALGVTGVEMQGLVDLVDFRQIVERARKSSEALVRVSLNVFGPQTASEEVGKILSNRKIFLQQPDHIPPGMHYHNPHELQLDQGHDTQPQNVELNDDESSVAAPQEELSTAVDNIYKSLKRGANLRRMEADASLQTDLLPHQQEALDFMTQREDGPIPSEFLLWQ